MFGCVCSSLERTKKNIILLFYFFLKLPSFCSFLSTFFIIKYLNVKRFRRTKVDKMMTKNLKADNKKQEIIEFGHFCLVAFCRIGVLSIDHFETLFLSLPGHTSCLAL
ncbi:unnamed protein product [Meloidogyne enterolobii]|uniref:Uncharacterized protein n=1 Tax=Meloidogyne enterolobii TaxID=390850 RepID=A0ACB0ZG99_MELEN